jgi:hypothetical protein
MNSTPAISGGWQAAALVRANQKSYYFYVSLGP